MKLPELFIFDMDGLIFDTERLFMRELGKVMKENGYILTEEVYITTLGMTGKTLVKRMQEVYGEDYPCREMGRKTRDRIQVIVRNDGMPVKKGIVNLLEFIKDKKCCVASSTDAAYIREYLEIAGLDKYFDFVIGGNMVAKSKPEPDIFLKACETAGVLPEAAMVFEDSENGVRAAYGANIPVICIPDMKQPCDEIVSKALFVAKDADCVIEFLKR